VSVVVDSCRERAANRAGVRCGEDKAEALVKIANACMEMMELLGGGNELLDWR